MKRRRTPTPTQLLDQAHVEYVDALLVLDNAQADFRLVIQRVRKAEQRVKIAHAALDSAEKAARQAAK